MRTKMSYKREKSAFSSGVGILRKDDMSVSLHGRYLLVPRSIFKSVFLAVHFSELVTLVSVEIIGNLVVLHPAAI